MFKIDSNIPLPSAGGRGPRTEYPFNDMDIGQSFFVPGMTVKKMSGQVSYWKKEPHNMHFAIRAVVEDHVNEDGDLEEGVEGVRIWKIEPSDKSRRGRKATVASAAAATAAPTEEAGETEAETAEATEAPKKKKKKSDDSDY